MSNPRDLSGRNNSRVSLLQFFQAWLAFALALAVLGIDFAFDGPVVVPVLYVLAVSLGVRIQQARRILWLAALCTAFSYIGILSVEAPNLGPVEWTNRSFVVLAIWLNAIFVLRQKKMNARLSESERRFRSMADAAPVMIWMCDADQRYNYLNLAWLNFTGRPLQDELDSGWFNEVHPDDLPRRLKVQAEGFSMRKNFVCEYRLREKGGQYLWVLDHGAPRFSESGVFLGFVGSCVDIHERKQKELAGTLLRAIVESSDDAIVSKDLDGRITSWNAGAERIFGYTSQEMIGQSIDRIIPLELRAEEPAILQKIRQGQLVQHYETRRVTKAGETIDVDLTVSPLRDARGVVVGASKISRDITQKKRAEAELLQEKNNLERVNLELDRFVYIASHDLRSPLRSIASFAAFISEDYAPILDEKGRDYLAEISRGARKMGKLIDDLLTMSRMSRIHAFKELVSANSLVDDALERLSTDVRRSQARLEVQANMPQVFCDRFKMTEVFVNLISNALKFSQGPGRHPQIEIGCVAGNEALEFFVKDNGIGIEPEYQNGIFDMFARLHTDREFEGTGLGLYIAKRIVQETGGRIWVRSEPGRGADFHFTFPV